MRVAGAMGLDATSRVLDVGSGQGASAVHLTRTIVCQLVGITLERDGVDGGTALASQHGVADLVTFVQGDILDHGSKPELRQQSFDAVLMECVCSILPDKAAAMRQVNALLRPGDRLGLTDVTVDGALPPALQGVLGVVGCVGDALSLQGYRDLAGAAGLVVEESLDLAETASTFLRNIKGGMLAAEVAVGLGKVQMDRGILDMARPAVDAASDLVRHGTLGYGMVIARKPA